MSVQVRRRRETAAFLSSFVGAQGELLVDTTNNRVQVHDGVTPGGWPAARLSEVTTRGRTALADTAYTALASDRTIAFTALTAARTVTLPAASAYPTGTRLVVVDESGACSAANIISITPAGSDKINGASGTTIAIAYGYVAIVSDGASKWTIVDLATVSSGGGSGSGIDQSNVAITGGSISGVQLHITNANVVFDNNVGILGTLTTGTQVVLLSLDSGNSVFFGSPAITGSLGFIPGHNQDIRFISSDYSYYFFACRDQSKQISFGGYNFDSKWTFFDDIPTTGDSAISLRDGAARPARFRLGNNGGTYDVGFSRDAAGTLAVNDASTTTTNYRDLKARALVATASLNLPSYTVATLPAPGTAGRVVFCSNARMQTGSGTIEAAGAGTGGLVSDNGSAWKIVGTNVTASA